MKLLTFALLLAALPLLPQERPRVSLERAFDQSLQAQQIAVAIRANQPFELPDMVLGTAAKVTATQWISDDGYVLKLSGVEIRTDKLIVQADQLSFRWATGEIEPSGNVRVKAVQK